MPADLLFVPRILRKIMRHHTNQIRPEQILDIIQNTPLVQQIVNPPTMPMPPID